MKVAFVGPTLPDASPLAEGIVVRPPAAQGDILRAVESGASAIGLIDGNFEYVAPVWHKEILYALSQGVEVFGAASMGALRAAECAAFGMVGVGEIYRQYATGERVDDADVALLHGPAELNYLPLTLPLVNVDATLAHLEESRSLSAELCIAIRTAAAGIFYKERTWLAICESAGLAKDMNVAVLAGVLTGAVIDQKRLDALQLLDAVQHAQTQRTVVPRDWKFNSTSMWKSLSGQPDASS
ncbi:TfuA-like protein [Ensifer sp. MJa1]|uniref:TfuA-like protein n=1 Tax=Ensifer sp. MJa1 TaxID=2919888 RepID=UPI00300BCCB2